MSYMRKSMVKISIFLLIYYFYILFREVVHDIRDLQEACLDPNRFLESSIVEPMAGCSCPIMIDFIESDIRLCLDDILNDVIVRTTVK